MGGRKEKVSKVLEGIKGITGRGGRIECLPIHGALLKPRGRDSSG